MSDAVTSALFPTLQTPTPLITIIIPTTCSANRAESLRRAIGSIHEAGPGVSKILVAANGPNVDNDLAKQLLERGDLRYVYFEEGSSPKTISLAVPLVDTEYFGFLDDDDELLPNALLERLAILQSRPHAALVVSNGFINRCGKDSLCFRHLEKIQHDPFGALMLENWLPSCGGLFRKTSVGAAYFDNYHPYAEWSWLAFRLVLDNQDICVLDTPTFRIHADTPSSLSKSSQYRLSYISLYRKMLGCNPPDHIRSILQKKLSQAYHDASSHELKEGRLSKSLHYHLLSLSGEGGVVFIPYTRHIIARFLGDLRK